MTDDMTTEIRYIRGCRATCFEPLGHIAIEHGGNVNWDDLQVIKNAFWGEDVAAIEVYPPQGDVINSIDCRHLWRLGSGDFRPDLMGVRNGSTFTGDDSLEERYEVAWAEAWNVKAA